MRSRSVLCGALGAALASGCTITSVGAEDGPPRVQSDGLLEGHAAVGIREEDDFFRLRVLDGESDGALGEIVIWKLFRLELGALGASVGVGPFDLALGTLFYEPEVPDMGGESAGEAVPSSDVVPAGAESCEICARAGTGG